VPIEVAHFLRRTLDSGPELGPAYPGRRLGSLENYIALAPVSDIPVMTEISDIIDAWN
jgi:hypothetical protein